MREIIWTEFSRHIPKLLKHSEYGAHGLLHLPPGSLEPFEVVTGDTNSTPESVYREIFVIDPRPDRALAHADPIRDFGYRVKVVDRFFRFHINSSLSELGITVCAPAPFSFCNPVLGMGSPTPPILPSRPFRVANQFHSAAPSGLWSASVLAARSVGSSHLSTVLSRPFFGKTEQQERRAGLVR